MRCYCCTRLVCQKKKMKYIILACVLTVVIELAFFLLVGKRSRDFVFVCVLINIATNLTLNLILSLLYAAGWYGNLQVLALEVLVVFTEYRVYALLEGKSRKLMLLTIAANVITYGLGLIIF